MNTIPIRGKLVAPKSLVDELVTVGFRILPALLPFFLCIILFLHFVRRSYPTFGDLISVTSISDILSYLVRLYLSFPTDTLRLV